jgi:hypothetical protein
MAVMALSFRRAENIIPIFVFKLSNELMRECELSVAVIAPEHEGTLRKEYF